MIAKSKAIGVNEVKPKLKFSGLVVNTQYDFVFDDVYYFSVINKTTANLLYSIKPNAVYTPETEDEWNTMDSDVLVTAIERTKTISIYAKANCEAIEFAQLRLNR